MNLGQMFYEVERSTCGESKTHLIGKIGGNFQNLRNTFKN